MQFDINNRRYLERHVADEDLRVAKVMMSDGDSFVRLSSLSSESIEEKFFLGETYNSNIELTYVPLEFRFNKGIRPTSVTWDIEDTVPDERWAVCESELVAYDMKFAAVETNCPVNPHLKEFIEYALRGYVERQIMLKNPDGKPREIGESDLKYRVRGNRTDIYLGSYIERVESKWHPVVLECIIPKGSEYYLNENGEYLPSTLKLDKVLNDKIPYVEITLNENGK